MNINKKIKIVIIISIFILLNALNFNQRVYTDEKRSDWVSVDTVASVVHLGKIYDIYLVAGMPDDFMPYMEFGSLNVGTGKVINVVRVFSNLGSGVIVSEDGWFFTNYHVAEDGIEIRPTDKKDNLGNDIKMVFVSVHPGYMWVSINNKDEVKKGISGTVRYLAKTYAMYYDLDNPYDYRGHDLAVCRIIRKAEMNGDLPEEIGALSASDKFTFSKMDNPFNIDRINEYYITSIGYPGIGPQDSSSITRGEFIGYDSKTRSIINHTCTIGGGNSGGGLYYKDKLVGINTWLPQDTQGATISKAQPISYFINVIARCKLLYDERNEPAIKNLPEIKKEWIDSDPADDPYKKEVFLGIEAVSNVNQNNKLQNAFVYLYKDNVSLQEVYNYIDFELKFEIFYFTFLLKSQNNNLSTVDIVNYLVQLPYFQILGIQPLNLTLFVSRIINMDENQFYNSLTNEEKKYFEIIKNQQFYASLLFTDENGKVIFTAEPNSKYKIAIAQNGYEIKEIKYTTNKDLIQGPFQIKVNNL